MPTATEQAAPIAHNFADDGRIPNNPALPLIFYRGGNSQSSTSRSGRQRRRKRCHRLRTETAIFQ